MAIKPDFKRFLQQVALVAGGVILLGMLLSGIQRKRSSDSIDFKVEILGKKTEQFITENEVRKTIQKRFGHVLSGVPIGSLNVVEIEKVLEADPFILHADVYVDAVYKVRVRIKQRQPLVRVIDSKGNQFFLDEQGEKMPLSPNFTPRVLVANGNIPNWSDGFLEKKGNSLKEVFILAKAIEKDPFLKALADQIYVEKDKDLVIIPKIGDHKIIFGNTSQMDEKLANLKIFYREGIPYTGWRKYKTINLKFHGQVVCTKN